MTNLFGQDDFDIRLDWGATGASTLQADSSVVVDVLSFSTTVTIAVGRGIQVFPYRWDDAGAESFAAEHDAVLAVGRLEATKHGGAPPSLSPAGLLVAEPVSRRVNAGGVTTRSGRHSKIIWVPARSCPRSARVGIPLA